LAAHLSTGGASLFETRGSIKIMKKRDSAGTPPFVTSGVASGRIGLVGNQNRAK